MIAPQLAGIVPTDLVYLGNIGPGFGMVGPMNSYLPFPDSTKLIMVVLMWIGRLEILPVLVILTDAYWRGRKPAWSRQFFNLARHPPAQEATTVLATSASPADFRPESQYLCTYSSSGPVTSARP